MKERIPTANEMYFSDIPADAARLEALERRFFQSVGLPNGTWKTTAYRRLDDLNELVQRFLPAERPLVLRGLAGLGGIGGVGAQDPGGGTGAGGGAALGGAAPGGTLPGVSVPGWSVMHVSHWALGGRVPGRSPAADGSV